MVLLNLKSVDGAVYGKIKAGAAEGLWGRLLGYVKTNSFIWSQKIPLPRKNSVFSVAYSTLRKILTTEILVEDIKCLLMKQNRFENQGLPWL